MSAPGGSQRQSSHVQPPAEEPPEFDPVKLELFKVRFITDLEPAESDAVIDICLLAQDIHELLTEVQEAYHQHKTSLRAEVELLQQIDSMIEASLGTQRFTTTYLHLLQELAIDFDSTSGHGGFRTFMRSHFVRRFCQDIYEHQLDARSTLTECKIKIYFRTASRTITDDFGAVAHYMAHVGTYFDREFKKYAMGIFEKKPTNEDIGKLRGMVCCMCFHGVRSLGRLFAHGQVLRRRLEAFEQTFQRIWLSLPVEAVDKISYHLAIVRDVLHSARQMTMTLIALAMRFVHDDEDDRFISYCREQEERTAGIADLMYGAQERIDLLVEMIRHLTNDFSAESTKRDLFLRSTISGDPLEKRMRRLDENMVQEGYTVLVVHDGSEDCTELALYLQSEIHKRRYSCYIEGREDDAFEDSEVIMDQTERALDDAFIGVFLLTPELAKRKKKVSRIQHMINRVRTAGVGWPGPTLIPVFFEVSIADCRTRKIFGEESEWMDEDVGREAAERAFHFITRYTGIENIEGAKTGNGEEMDKSCERLMRRTADAVAEVMLTTVKEHMEQTLQERNNEVSDEFRAHIGELWELIGMYRRWQREAREKATFLREKDPFRGD